ncbi:hypothetical protein B0H16DRAFT_1717452 [Mycena metata]|uniref:Uncharacterized protein n=1 Tax=Mycena metata TaxID=1033252 RepID=A0AAD7NMC9_9AGAR|nr:hypothetical protein B0H16DRAFT_1717452 [Mycena metata]
MFEVLQGLDDVHYKIITSKRLDAHERIWLMYKTWADAYHEALGKLANPPITPSPPREALPNVLPPTLQQLKGFCLHLARTVRGRLGDWPCKTTIHGYVTTFYALWLRRTSVAVSTSDKAQVSAYLASNEFLVKCPLVTAERSKPVASFVDVRVLIDAIWRDQPGMRLPRERLQTVYGLQLIAYTSSRPGEIVVSGCHAGTGAALLWRDHEFFLVPNPDDPAHPFIYMHVLFHLLKGFRDNDAKYRSCVFRLDNENLDICPVWTAIMLAMKDKLMPDYATPTELLEPAYITGLWHVTQVIPPMPFRPFASN